MTTRPIEFPFVQGRHAEIDSQILPTGMLKSAENYRIEKSGRLVRRAGYTHVSADTASTIYRGCGDISTSERGGITTVDYVPRLMRLNGRRVVYAETNPRDLTTIANGGRTLLLERAGKRFTVKAAVVRLP